MDGIKDITGLSWKTYKILLKIVVITSICPCSHQKRIFNIYLFIAVSPLHSFILLLLPLLQLSPPIPLTLFCFFQKEISLFYIRSFLTIVQRLFTDVNNKGRSFLLCFLLIDQLIIIYSWWEVGQFLLG